MENAIEIYPLLADNDKKLLTNFALSIADIERTRQQPCEIPQTSEDK